MRVSIRLRVSLRASLQQMRRDSDRVVYIVQGLQSCCVNVITPTPPQPLNRTHSFIRPIYVRNHRDVGTRRLSVSPACRSILRPAARVYCTVFLLLACIYVNTLLLLVLCVLCVCATTTLKGDSGKAEGGPEGQGAGQKGGPKDKEGSY